jgi:hypothetical protein
LQDMGPSMIMHDGDLQRIVDAAHHGKITDLEQLLRYTRWPLVRVYGEEVLSIIKRFQPAPATPFSTRTPLQPRAQLNSSADPEATSTKIKRRNKCGACNHEGHIGQCWAPKRAQEYSSRRPASNRSKCTMHPLHPSRVSAPSNNENAPLVALETNVVRVGTMPGEFSHLLNTSTRPHCSLCLVLGGSFCAEIAPVSFYAT